MATRIDKKIAKNLDILNSPSSLQNYLVRRASRKINDIKYIGLKRNSALSDLDDPSVGFSNILEAITKIDDSTEISVYGKFKPIDYSITGDFIENQISKSFLSPLKEASILGGFFGSTTSVNPRIRIQDRINQINSFTGEGTLDNLHSGPLSIFYKEPIGDKFSKDTFKTRVNAYNPNTGKITLGANTLIDPDNLSSTSQKILLSLKGYKVYSSTDPALVINEKDLGGLEIYCYVILEGTTRVAYIKDARTGSGNSKSLFNSIITALNPIQSQVEFIFGRRYSFKYAPDWYTKSPGANDVGVDGGPDDINPETSFALLSYDSGTYSLTTQRGYYETGSHVETRVIPEFRDVYNGNNVVLDSNMVFESAPPQINFSDYNWGVRWDGYLRLDGDINTGRYRFEIETNTQIKIDIASDVDGNGDPVWTNVFDTYKSNNCTIFPNERDRFVSKYSFKLNELSDKFIYYTDANKTSGRRYVPISIRLFNGSNDVSFLDEAVPTLPNMYLKVGYNSGTDLQTFYGGDINVNISTLSGVNKKVILSQTYNSLDDADPFVIAGDLSASYSASIVEKLELQTVVTGIDNVTGEPITASQAKFVTLDPPVVVRFQNSDSNTLLKTEEGADISIDDGEYKIRIIPQGDYPSYNLWSRYFVSPSDNYNGYGDLTGFDESSFNPSIYKNNFDTKPEWWKVSTGHRYLPGETISKDNDPIDGFLSLFFRGSLTPPAPSIGLYGDGSGNYTNRNNLILGERKYSPSDILGSNYIGLKLIPNKLGEGGKLIARALPVNNAAFEFPAPSITGDSKTDRSNVPLDSSELGGGTNNRTSAYSSYTNYQSFRVYWNVAAQAFLLHDIEGNPPVIPAANDTSFLSLPAFTNNLEWSAPIKLICVGFSTTQNGTLTPFASSLDLSVFRVVFDPSNNSIDFNATSISGNQKWLFAFKTTHPQAPATLSGKFLRGYSESDLAYSYAFIDTGDSLSIADTLKISYNNSGQFLSSVSEVPKGAAERVTPFGFDNKAEFSSLVCYPPYTISDSFMEKIAVNDFNLYSSTVGFYDVFWGNYYSPTLDNNVLSITEKLEFVFNKNLESGGQGTPEDPTGIIQSIQSNESITLRNTDYTHQIKVEFPLFDPENPTVPYDEDVYVHIGNKKRINDTYYLYVNGRSAPETTTSNLLPGL